MVIYKITNNVNGKIYIGQTHRSVESRIAEHVNSANRGDGYYLHSAIRLYGWNNFKYEVIAETDNSDVLNELESFYIRKYNSDIDGYNLSKGGYSNCMDNAAVRSKHDAKMRSPEVRKKISESMKARIAAAGGVSEEHRRHVSEGLKKFYAEGKRPNYSAPFHLTPAHKKALNDAKNKAVYCIDESGDIIAEFNRVCDAAVWWYDHGYVVKDKNTLCDRIKQSYKESRYIRGLKWIYRV